MEKPFDIVLLEHEIGGIELFVSSDEDIKSSMKLNKTVIVDKNNKVIGLNLNHCRLEDIKPLSKFKDLEYLYLSNNLIIDVNIIKTFKKLKFLDLSSNKIENIDSLCNLNQLENLYLDNNNLKEIPILTSKKLHEFFLGNNDIESIENLKSLENLFSLNFDNNRVRDISPLRFLNKLMHISMNSNELIDVSVLKEYKSLISLNISKNSIVDISSISNLRIIGELLLGENRIFDLSPLYFSLKKRQLNFIDALGNPLIYPPFEVLQKGEDVIVQWFDMIISNVKEKLAINKTNKDSILDIGNMGITDLSLIPEIFELKHLKELRLSNEWAEYDYENNKWKRKESKNNILKNNISNIPNEISKLINLERIICGGDWKSKKDKSYRNWRLKSISNLTLLKKLKYINVSNSTIENISDFIRFEKVEIAHFNNNYITNVPRLNDLKNLREIYLSNNKINNIDFLKDCIQIETIDLHSNEISDLVSLQELLRKSDIIIKNTSWEKNCISISKNSPNIIPPYEVLNQSKEDFFLYLKRLDYEIKLKLEPYSNNEIKIVLVGNSYSGKSTFLNYLKTKRYKKNLPSTHWLVTEELQNFIINKENFKLRFFDFGGQDYYHDTHKLFFTSDCVYLLLWDTESNKLGKIETERNGIFEDIQVFPLKYWLDSIKLYAKKTMSESELQMEQLLNERDRKINSKIRDSKNGDWTKDVFETNDFIKTINNPKNTLIIQNKIDIKKSYLNQTELTSYINNYNIYDFVNISISKKIGLKQLEEYYKEIIKDNINYKKPLLATWGIVKDRLNIIFKEDNFIIDLLVFKERINDFLTNWFEEQKVSKNNISYLLFKDEEAISFANFLKEVGLVIFDSENEELKNYIVVKQNDFIEQVYEILNEAKFNSGNIKFESNNKSYKNKVVQILINQNIIFENKTENKYIAPLFLPENPEYFVNLLIDEKTPFRRFKFQGFIPKNIILSVFSTLSKKEDLLKEDFYVWKNGLIFKDRSSNQKVLLKFDIGQSFNFAFIDIINLDSNNNITFIEEVIKTVKDIIVKECENFEEMVTLDGIYYARITDLLCCKENNIRFIRLNNKESIKETNVSNFDKFLPEDKRSYLKKAIISYSKRDLRLIEEFKLSSLGSIIQDELIDEWYCTDLIAGDIWNDEIQKRVQNCDIAFIMISKNSMNTDYIKNKEIKILIDRIKNPNEIVKPIIIPIILEPYHWTSKSEKYNLGQFSALPYTAKPVIDFKERSNAWYMIGECIRIAIENKMNSESILGKEYWKDYWSGREVGNDVKSLFIRLIEGKLDNNAN